MLEDGDQERDTLDNALLGPSYRIESFGVQSLGRRGSFLQHFVPEAEPSNEDSDEAPMARTSFASMASIRFKGVPADSAELEEEPSRSSLRTGMGKLASMSTRFKDMPLSPIDSPPLGEAARAQSMQRLRAPPPLPAPAAPDSSASSPQTSARGANPSRKYGKPRTLDGQQRAVPPARAMFNKMCGLPRAPQVTLTQQLWSRNLWEVLRGGARQQRVWTFGNSLLSGGAADDGVGRHTSQLPLPILEGAMMTMVAAGGGEWEQGGGSWWGGAGRRGREWESQWGGSRVRQKAYDQSFSVLH